MERLRFFHESVMAAGTTDQPAGFAQGATSTCQVFFLKNIPAQRTAEEILLLFFHSVTAKA
jgi:hypothetical protein